MIKTDGIKKTTLKVSRMLARNSPSILTGLSVAGLVTTVIMAVKATPKAMEILSDATYIRETGTTIPKMEILQLTWRCYVPTALMGGLTIGCIIGANSINLRRNAALASVYSLTETALKEYQAKVVETLGEKKAQKIKDDIYADKLAENPVGAREVIITGKGETLCYDVISGRYFKSDIDKVRKVENIINRRLMDEMFVSLNDVYELLGLSSTKLGDELGWDVNNGLIDFRFSAQLTEEDTPCVMLDYSIEPRYDYRDY